MRRPCQGVEIKLNEITNKYIVYYISFEKIMKSLKFYLVFFILFFPSLTLAAATQFIQLNKYYQAKCPNYIGTWQGFFTDPTDLFGNGGPWPVKVSIYNKENKIIGKVSAKNAPNYVAGAMHGTLWADCQDGQLNNIFLGKPNQCGSYSQTGLLVSKNVLILQINYENAMNNAPFLLFLKRVSDHYSGKIPATLKSMTISKPISCH